jgi:hypothetical protein
MDAEWALAASAFFAGLASGLLGMLSAIMRPLLAAMDGREFRNFIEAFYRDASRSWGKAFKKFWGVVGRGGVGLSASHTGGSRRG